MVAGFVFRARVPHSRGSGDETRPSPGGVGVGGQERRADQHRGRAWAYRPGPRPPSALGWAEAGVRPAEGPGDGRTDGEADAGKAAAPRSTPPGAGPATCALPGWSLTGARPPPKPEASPNLVISGLASAELALGALRDH